MKRFLKTLNMLSQLELFMISVNLGFAIGGFGCGDYGAAAFNAFAAWFVWWMTVRDAREEATQE